MVGISGSDWRLEKAARFLQAAERAFINQDWETTVSRAYYSAYHATAALLDIKANLRRDRWDHSELRTAFRDRFARRGLLFSIRQAQDLDYLWEQRLVADYRRGNLRRRLAEQALRVSSDLNQRIIEVIRDG